MDPISQAVLGAAAAQNIAVRQKHLGLAALLGALSAMAPDLDILISSSEDPLLSMEYHRHFTHSLIFIPAGGAVCALLLHPIARRLSENGISARRTFLYCIAGYATHPFLDACTSYGTQLLWPFSDMRVAWGNISIVDPLFTIPLVFLVIAASFSKMGYARAAAVWAAVYLCFGFVQKERAEAAVLGMASGLGDKPEKVFSTPRLGNMFLWRVIYEKEGGFQTNTVRVVRDSTAVTSGRVEKTIVARDFPWLWPDSQQARDLERFRWFSGGFIASHPDYPDSVIDVRYSAPPQKTVPLRIISLNPRAAPGEHVQYRWVRFENFTVREIISEWWKTITGKRPPEEEMHLQIGAENKKTAPVLK